MMNPIPPIEGRIPARLNRRAFLARSRSAAAAIAGACGLGRLAGLDLRPAAAAEKEVLPKHVTPETLRSVIKGMDFLAGRQAEDGSWIVGGGEAYPVAMTGLAGTAMLAHGNSPTRGHYSKNLQSAVEYLVRCGTATGLITGPTQDSGMPMHGHGFALMFLACVYGMITKESLRNQVRTVIRKAVALTSQGQSAEGGWTYVPGAGDEGSVTVTQVQALRAAHNAGFLVPKAVIEEATKYLERCRTPEGGIEYSLRSGRRAPAADLGRRRRHPVQRRPVRQHHRHRLPQVRLGPVPRQRGIRKGGRTRVLHPPVRLAGLLHGRRPVLGRLLPRGPATS